MGVTELASIALTTMADDEVEFMQTDVFVHYCVYLCVQYRATYVQKPLENVGEAVDAEKCKVVGYELATQYREKNGPRVQLMEDINVKFVSSCSHVLEQ